MDPKLKNIVILGMFSDKKVRQLICVENQQRAVIAVIRAMESDNTVKVLDKEVELIEWDSPIDISKNEKYDKRINKNRKKL